MEQKDPIKNDVEDIIKEVDEEEKIEEEKEEKEDDASKVIIVVSAIIIAFAILFSAGYIHTKYYEEPEEPVLQMEYKGFEFLYYNDLWNFEWQRGDELFKVHLRFNPKEVEEVQVVQVSPFNNFTTDTVYITFDPLGVTSENMALAVGEFSLSMKKVFARTPVPACMRDDEEVCSGLEIITCDNTNESVVVFQEGNETLVTVNDNCIVIQGEDEEILRAVDRVLYEWYGII